MQINVDVAAQAEQFRKTGSLTLDLGEQFLKQVKTFQNNSQKMKS